MDFGDIDPSDWAAAQRRGEILSTLPADGIRALIAARDGPSASSIDVMTFAAPLTEQPRLSLDARRSNPAFLTEPIARQALLVVAPEYNRFAPVFAKPVRPGLDAIARGLLLQTYALAVAVARLTENLVEYAAATRAAADAEGETSLRRVLRSWPWATRRRIDTHLRRRLLAANSAAKITAGQPNRGRLATQFHKLWGRLREGAESYAKEPTIDILL